MVAGTLPALLRIREIPDAGELITVACTLADNRMMHQHNMVRIRCQTSFMIIESTNVLVAWCPAGWGVLRAYTSGIRDSSALRTPFSRVLNRWRL